MHGWIDDKGIDKDSHGVQKYPPFIYFFLSEGLGVVWFQELNFSLCHVKENLSI